MTNMHDDGVFNDYQYSDKEFDDEIASIDIQTSMMDHNVSNDLIDCQMNSKDDDNDDDDVDVESNDSQANLKDVDDKDDG